MFRLAAVEEPLNRARGTLLAVRPDRAETNRRKDALSGYYASCIMRDGAFTCAQYSRCRASHPGPFAEGQVHYVGDDYDLRVGTRPFRVAVIGQEYGHGGALVGVEARREMLHRSAFSSGGFNGRNPHMRGTTTALRILFGSGPGADEAGEWLHPAEGEPIHLFNAFALVNFLLCSATDGTTRGRSTRTMRSNCSQHFRAVMEILEPNVIICQGKGFFGAVAKTLGVGRAVDQVFEFEIGGAGGLGVCLNHPSTPRWIHGWGRLEQPYLREVVEPALSEIRSRLVG